MLSEAGVIMLPPAQVAQVRKFGTHINAVVTTTGEVYEASIFIGEFGPDALASLAWCHLLSREGPYHLII
jgi:hypothetical protein